MPLYEVFARETIFESCMVAADTPEEAMRLAQEGDENYEWTTYDGEDFEIEYAQLGEDEWAVRK